jgi:hypothetical protein
MACPTKNIKFQLRRDTADNWNSFDPKLLPGEPGFDTTNQSLKIGDGVHKWSELPYLNSYG